ncbi:Breast cancer 2, early onset [Mortierella sp. GBA43]|nr:Breast cancer 2, early onset [Mortierella sp. GBA43]
MTLEGLQLDSWGMTSSMEGDRSIRTDQNRNTQRTDRNNAEPTPDDDFDSLRYSQLDEAFSATQASPQEYRQDQTAPVKAKVPDPSSSDMEQDTSSFSASHTSGNGSTLGGFYTTRTRQNQLVGGGFTSNWEKILPTPPGSKPTEATGSGNGHLSSSGIVNTAIAMPEGFVQHDPFNATGGFRSAGKGSLPTISKTALERAARMFQDEDLGMESTMASTEDHSGQSRMVGFKSAGKGPLPMISKASREKAAQIFQDEDLMGPAMESTSDHPVQPRMGGGFKSAGKGSLPMISKASIEKAARMFRDEDQMGSAMESTNDHSGRPRMTGGFKSAGKGSLPTISNASREKAARMFQDEDLMGSTKESANDHPGKLRMAGGFKSAGGGSLPTISKTSLERAAQMFQDEDVGTGSRMELTDNHPVQPTMAGGFKSAGKGQLPLISKASLERAAQMFQDEDVGIGSRMELTDDHLDQSRMVGGFSSAGKGSLPMISKASIERAERMFQDEDLGIRSTMAPTDDHSGQSRMTGGFKSVGKGPLPAISKASIEKAARMFQDEDPWTASTMVTMDDCSDGSRTMNSGSDASSLNTSMSEKTISSTQQSQASVFSGFSNGKGGALTPISKAAQVHARSLLEMDEPRTTTVMRKPPMNPALSSNGSQSSMATGSWPSGPSTIQQQPSISPFMSNLMRKTMRAPGSSLAGKHTPKTKPFKSPMRLVQPTKKPSDYIGVGGSSNDMVNYENTSAGKAQTMDKRPVGKRTTLHPNAHIMSTSSMDPPTGLQRTTHNTEPSYTPLFNLQGNANLRSSLMFAKNEVHEPEAAVEMTLADARSYHFGTWGAEEAYRDLIARGAIPNLLSKVWVSNHYGLIVWKLACYIRTWPQHFLSQQPPWFCPTRVLDQLAYRYEREINLAERPALRKIVERDESAGRHMVLCIASVAMEHSEEAIEDVLKVTVTDGWYVLPATLDPCLTRAVERGRLKVGSKVHVCRAKLSGAEDGVAILELAGAGSTATAVSIALQANSTRLARWDTKLGFQSTPIVWTTQLRSISPEGGLVPGLDVVVLRKYPVLYMETMEDGVTKVKRTEREESRAAEAHTELMQKRYQDMVEEVERRHGTGANPVQIQNEIEAKTSELMAKASTRDVVPVFIIRVGNYAGNLSHRDINDNGRHQEALVTFWHSDHTPYQEGHRARITSLIAKRTSREFGLEDVLQLTSTRTTTVKDMPTDPVAMDLTKYQPREVIPCEAIEYLDQGTEVDLAVIILAVSDRVISSNRVYMVVTDSSRELVLVEHQVSANQISPSFLKVHARVLMANVRFKMRDYKLGIDVVQSLQNYTRITAASSSSSSASGWPVYAQPSLQQLNDMVNSRRPQGAMEDKNGLVKLMSRANSLIADMQQPCL